MLSIQVGRPREVAVPTALARSGRTPKPWITAIYKEPVRGPIWLGREGLTGDSQVNRKYHGGPERALLVYAASHYPAWRAELDRPELAFGAFGENLTVEGLPLEDEIAVGDRLRAGAAELVVTQPRVPCYKLGLRFGRDDMVKRFLDAARPGYYLAVAVEGDVAAGDTVEIVAQHPARVPVAEVIRVYASDRDDVASLERLAALDALPVAWRRYFAERLPASAL